MEHGNRLVSMGMATRNRAHCIRYALDALLGQTYQDIELIIADGASEDTTQEICEEYAKKDPRIRYFRQPHNNGNIGDFNITLGKARGDYFMWVGDDDWWDPQFVATMVRTLESHPTYDTAMSFFSEHVENPYHPDRHGKTFTHHFTDKNYASVYRTMIRAKTNPIFWFAMYRTAKLRLLFRRLVPHCIEDVTVFLCEVALSIRCYSVPQVLMSRYRDPRPLAIRHAYLGALSREPFPRTRHIATMLWWLVTSPNIPWSRKHLIILPWSELLWRSKRKITQEIIGVFRPTRYANI